MNYRYKQDLFPTIRFRMAYDSLSDTNSAQASKEYLKILYLAAHESESGVDKALYELFKKEGKITYSSVKNLLKASSTTSLPHDVLVKKTDLNIYDGLLGNTSEMNHGRA